MRIVRDMGYVKRRKRIATISAIGGVALLAASFWLATTATDNPNVVLLAYLPLLAGTVVFHFGMQQVAKWNRSPRNDVLLDNLLKGFGDKYALVHYARVGKRVIEHLLVHPGGVLSLTVRELPGEVAYEQGRWRKRGGGLTRFFGMGGPQLGNPSLDAQADLDAVRAVLADERREVETDAAIVFVNPRVVLDVEEPDFPVTNGQGLAELVRQLPADPSFTPAERQALVDALAQGQAVETQQPVQRRRPVKRRAA